MQKNSNQQWPRGIWGTFTESAYSQIQRVKWSVAQSSLKDARLWGSGHHCVINHVINHCSPLSPRWRRRGLVVQAPLGDASASSVVSWIHTLYLYFIICIRYPVNATCEPWLCCSVPCMRHLLHVCLSWESDLTSCFFHLFFYPALKGFFLNVAHFAHLNCGDIVHCTDSKAHCGNVIVILGYRNKKDLMRIGFDCHVMGKKDFFW